MKSQTLRLASKRLILSLLGGVTLSGAALAQTPPAPAPKPPATSPAPTPVPTPPAPPPAAPQAPPAFQGQAGAPGAQSAQSNQPAIPTPSGPPEGMIVETPNGFYIVRPGEQTPQRLDLGRGGQPGMAQPGMAQPGMAQPGANGPARGQGPAAMAGDEDAMGDMPGGGMAADGMQQPPPPHPRRPPPRPPEGKGARLHIHAPNLDVNVKCPDDEPIKACVDAVSQLMDKANTAAH